MSRASVTANGINPSIPAFRTGPGHGADTPSRARSGDSVISTRAESSRLILSSTVSTGIRIARSKARWIPAPSASLLWTSPRSSTSNANVPWAGSRIVSATMCEPSNASGPDSPIVSGHAPIRSLAF